ncbi:MAG TPA: hypothetical protein VGF67_30985 [Ktedonobacteraceae bacterium]|jgi:hypothetical protein
MKSLLNAYIVRWQTMALLAGLLAICAQTLCVLPARAVGCNPGLALDASGGSASCDMGVLAQINAGVLTLANDTDATVPGSPFTLSGTPVLATFSFSNFVRDHRGSADGWAEQAASSGLVGPLATLPLNLTSLDPSSSCTSGTCPPPTFTPVTPLTPVPARFLAAGNVLHTIVVDGDYTSKINGNFTIPAGAASGVYSGVVTITLLNSF